MTDRVELVKKETKDGKFTGIIFYLYLPITRKLGIYRIRTTYQERVPFILKREMELLK
jgi:hypothetical protein